MSNNPSQSPLLDALRTANHYLSEIHAGNSFSEPILWRVISANQSILLGSVANQPAHGGEVKDHLQSHLKELVRVTGQFLDGSLVTFPTQALAQAQAALDYADRADKQQPKRAISAAELVADVSDHKLETLSHAQLVNLVKGLRQEAKAELAGEDCSATVQAALRGFDKADKPGQKPRTPGGLTP